MSDTPDIPGGEDPIDPIEPTDSQPTETNGNGHKNGKNGAHALDKPKNGNGNGKHAVDDLKENGKENGQAKNGKNGKTKDANGKNGNGKNGSLFSDKRFQIGILATLVIASLGVWWVIFQQVSDGNGRDLPAPAGEFDPSLVTESTGEPVAESPAEAVAPETGTIESDLPSSEGATGDALVATGGGTTVDSEAVVDDASSITGDAELRERGYFDAIFKFRDPFLEPSNPVTGSAG